MDQNSQDTFLLSDLNELGSVDAEPGAHDATCRAETANVQTVYAPLPAAVLEEGGYRHIYVTVDTQADLASFTAATAGGGGSSGNTYPEVTLGNGANIVTVAVPAGQLIGEAGTFIIQPPTVPVTAAGTGSRDAGGGTDSRPCQQGKEHQLVLTADVASVPSEAIPVSGSTEPETHVFTADPTTLVTTRQDHGGSAACPLPVSSSTTTIPGDGSLLVSHSTPQSHVLTAEQLMKKDVDSKVSVPLVMCRCDARRSNMKTSQTIFTSVHAKLAGRLLETIPGCTDTFIHQFVMQHDMKLCQEEGQDSASLQVSGDLHKVLCLHDNLSQLVAANQPGGAQASMSTDYSLPAQRSAALPGSTKDKAVLCDLLQPQYSRSGRQIKRKNLEHPMERSAVIIEATPSSVSSTRQYKAGTTGRKRRGRPPKYLKNTEPEEKDPKDEYALKSSESTVILEHPDVETRLEAPEAQDPLPAEADQEVSSIVSGEGQNHSVQEGGLIALEETVGTIQTLQTIKEGVTQTDHHSDGDMMENQGLSEKENTQDEEADTAESQKGAGDGPSRVGGGRERHLPPGLVLGRRRHKKDYESLAPFKFYCSMCSFRTKRRSHYIKHLMVHSKKSLPLLHCGQCKFTAIRLSHLRRHQLTHSSQVFPCKQCNYKTDDVKRLSRHHRIKHPAGREHSNNFVIYECKTCEYKTLKAHQYYRHLRCHASICGGPANQTSSSYQCPLCPYKTQRKEHYSRHVANVHTDRRPYLCDLCGKAFKRPDALRQHKQVHQDRTSRPFRHTCQVCFKGFMSHAHLLEHRTRHTDERSYLCEICGAAFKTRSVQRKHVQTIHKNPRAHPCPTCQKRFNTKYALQRHLRTHSQGQGALRTSTAAAAPQHSLTMTGLEGAAAAAAANTTTTMTVIPATSEAAQIIQELQESAERQRGGGGGRSSGGTGQVVDEEEEAAAVMAVHAIATSTASASIGPEEATVTYEEGGEEDDEEEEESGQQQQLQQATYIHTSNEATTALLYLTGTCMPATY